MSVVKGLEKLKISALNPSEVILLIDSLSPSEVIAEPASIKSTPISSN